MMNLKLGSISLAVLWMGIMALPALAQDDTACPDLVQTAYETTQTSCDGTGRDEACYGNNVVAAEPQPEIDDFQFEAPGDVEDVGEIATLRLSAMDAAAQAWGMSLIRIQADLPDVSANYVELLLFGNVEIENRGSTADNPTPYRAMQAFYFTSGVDDRPCEAAPESGILIQTPEGEGEITVLVNEVIIELGSTAYLQAQPNDEMVINVIEGQGTVTSGGSTIIVPAGMFTTVPLNEEGTAAGAPTEPQPYDDSELAALPLLLLTRQIGVEPSPAGTGTPPESDSVPSAAGIWSVAETCTSNSTWTNATWGIAVSEWNTEIALSENTLTIGWPTSISRFADISYTKNDEGAFTYMDSWSDEHGVYAITQTIQVLAPDHLQGVSTWTLSTEDFPFMECQQEYHLAGAE